MTERASEELEVGAFDADLERLPGSGADYDWDQILDVLYEDNDYIGLMASKGKLDAQTVVGMVERFTHLPEREYATIS